MLGDTGEEERRRERRQGVPFLLLLRGDTGEEESRREGEIGRDICLAFYLRREKEITITLLSLRFYCFICFALFWKGEGRKTRK